MRKELYNARKAVDLTQAEIAQITGIERTKYNRIERGGVDPKVDEAISIAKAVGKKVEEVFIPINVQQIHKENKAV